MPEETNPPPSQPAQDAREFVGREKAILPVVTVPGGSVTITESAEALFDAIAPSKNLFYRGGVVVELVHDEAERSVQILDPVSAQSRFEKYVRFVKSAKQGEEAAPTTISETVAKQYLKSEAARTRLPKLNGMLRCPMLVEKGARLIRVENGYDETTGFFVTSAKEAEVVTLADAVVYLTNWLSDFDFVTLGDRSRAIASLLTPALKLGGLIRGPVPVDVAEANASQSGKSYRQKLVAALYNQRPAVVTKKGGGVGSMEETFSDHLVKGHPFIQFDNVRGKLDSQYLESFMTADTMFPARIPFHGTVNVDPSKFILFISSNGFEATQDLTNRASIIRIRKREHYQFRNFQGMDTLEFTFAYNSLLIGAVFAVVEEWHRLGKLRTTETRHDFREWCQALDWIVQNIFKTAPLMDGHDAAKQRAASPQLSFLRVVAIKLNERNRLAQQVTASDIADLCLEEDIELPGVPADSQTSDQGPMQVGKIMGNLFKNANDAGELLFDEFKVVKTQARVQTTTGNPTTQNRYTFTLAPPAPPDTQNTPEKP